MKRKNIYLISIWAGFWFLLASTTGLYAFSSSSSSKNFRFNHKHHVGALEIECSTCHLPAKDGVSMSYPDHATCATCHDVEDQGKCNFCHLDSKQFKSFRTQKAFENVSFSHEKHRQKNVDCLDCHIKMDKRVKNNGKAGLPDMGTCLNCHKELKAPVTKNCNFCHPVSVATEKPKSHSPLWLRQHGAGLPTDQKQSQCAYCHNGAIQKSCVDCHKSEKPASHTVTFEVKRHGQLSRLDRQRCMTCHEQQSCLTCHQRTRPFSHTGMYGTPYNRHCNNCHLTGNASAISSTSSNCFFCHTPANANARHLQKGLLPAGHARTNCLGCHRFGGGAGIVVMKHPGGGGDASCLQCHR